MVKIPFFHAFLCVLSLFLALNACKHAELTTLPDPVGVACNPDTVYFQNQILPLLTSTCAMSNCHDAQYHSVGIILTDYANTIKLVVPGNAEASVLFTTITNSEPTDRMPISPSPDWNAAQVNLLKKWINQGALNNACNENQGACDTTGITYANFVEPLIQNRCLGCHIKSEWGGGVFLDTYTAVKSSAASGRLLGSLQHETAYSPMPKLQSALPACAIDKIKAWIKGGMKQ